MAKYRRLMLFIATVLSLGTAVSEGTPSHSEPVVEGYWESWNSAVSIETIVNMNVDLIDISFANFKKIAPHVYELAGLDCDQDTLMRFVSAVHQEGKKVKISIGGATYGLGAQLVSMEDAYGMARAVAHFVHENQLDGVDYDIEDYPAAQFQVALLQFTRELLGEHLLISYTAKTPASTTLPYAEVIRKGHSYLNTISLMAYDFGPGYTYQHDIERLIAMGVPAEKIVIGLMPGYDDLNVRTSIADIVEAAGYLLDHQLGGIMFWDLNRDHQNSTGLGVDAATNIAWQILK